MKKLLIIFAVIPCLTYCYYDWEGGCIRPLIQTVASSCYSNKGEEWPYVAQFQKIGQSGQTDSQQRWRDIQSCGGIDINKTLNTFAIKNERNQYGSMNLPVLEAFENCMANKGYHRYWPAECGYQDPKWNTGKCNL